MIMNLIKHAKELLFTNTGTNLQADNVQDAIVEIDSNLSDKLQVRCTKSVVGSSVASKTCGAVNSTIPYVNGDICVLTLGSSTMAIASPYVNSNNNWCAIYYNGNSSSSTVDITFNILNKA